ncbi:MULTISPECIES: sensor histidine kinase [unclassified Streptomyces]|uniref:sensor histidine kinase n=1 Tax=unclassified Streptomyces TaxID=2593676 RepID=UPI00225434D2|nr:histidine kinase [Streptomyces sp. NBC_00401]MCX5083231.1 histidine kinase [Streptomyces sp. NBC_00401]
MRPPARSTGLLLWAALAVPVAAAGRLGLERTPLWAQLTGLAVLAAATALHRTWPATALLLAAAPGIATSPSFFTLSYGCAPAVFAFLLGLRGTATGVALLSFAAVAAAGTAKIAVRQVDPAAEWLVLMGTLLFGAVFPWLIGRYWRQSRELTAAGWARAEQLEREHRIIADRARLRERARIAQDMHDSLGHELSLIALRAGALQVAPGMAEAHRTAAAELRAAASDATDRLHDMVGLLREDDEPAPLAPPGESIAALIERAADSGLPVTLHRTDTTATSATTTRTTYRVIQEALTNAAKHAPGAPVTVEHAQNESGTTVDITNGRPRHRAGPAGSGTGLIGLRAGVTALGGSFEAGPHGEGYRVSANIPTRKTAGPDTATPGALFTSARRLAHRRVGVAFGAAAAVGAVLIGGAFAWYAYTKTHAVLTPTAYVALKIGTPLEETVPRLPDRTISDPPVDRAPTPPPPGTDCRYYRASGELFVPVDHFRLCFDKDDRHELLEKSVIPRPGTTDQVQEQRREWAR